LCSIVASQPRSNHNGLKSLNFFFEPGSEEQSRHADADAMSRRCDALLFQSACSLLRKNLNEKFEPMINPPQDNTLLALLPPGRDGHAGLGRS